jgi:hypothetical protein
MLAFLSGRWTRRKATLYLCAGLRFLWDLLYAKDSRFAVEMAERAADGAASEDDIRRAKWYAECPTFGYDFEPESIRKFHAEYGWHGSGVLRLIEMGVYTEEDLQGDQRLGDERVRNRLLCAAGIAESALYVKEVEFATELLGALSLLEDWPKGWLVREVAGNPFRPARIDPAWLSWNGETVVHIARSIYDERAFGRLPILADALEDAGCDDTDILNHCRGDGPHVRGCWVVDLLLGKN